MKDKTDSELLSEVTGLHPDTITEENPKIYCSYALTAMSLLEKQMQGEIDLKNQALMHIAKVASKSRTLTRRLRWIEKRANYAIDNKPYHQEEFDMPKYAESNESLKAQIRKLKEQLSDLSDEYELNLCKKCLHPKAMVCPGEYQCVNTNCK